MSSHNGLWQSWEARVIGLFAGTPADLRLPAALEVSDMGMWPTQGGGMEHRVDSHVGYPAGERTLTALGYAPEDAWTDGEGVAVQRWVRRWAPAEWRARLQMMRRRQKA